MSERTLRLVEYQPRLVRLRIADVAALAQWSTIIDVQPTWQRSMYRVTAKGYVGVLRAGRLRMQLRPKIPRANIAYLLDPAQTATPDTSTPEHGTELIDILGRMLARLMLQRAAMGLPRTYVEITDQQPFMQGRLDMVAQSRELPTAKDRFHVQREEFTVNSPLHQFAKHSAIQLASSLDVHPSTAVLLRTALQAWSEVNARAYATAIVQGWWPRLNPQDRTLAEISWQIAHALQPGEVSGSAQGPAFVVNMASVFERYITRGLEAMWPDEVHAQRPFCYHEPVPHGQPIIVGQPDIQLGSPTRCVLDVKWKPLGDTPPADDVQQVLAYALGLGCRDVRLIYPARRSAQWVYTLSNNGRFTVHALGIVGSANRCRNAFHRFARSLR